MPKTSKNTDSANETNSDDSQSTSIDIEEMEHTQEDEEGKELSPNDEMEHENSIFPTHDDNDDSDDESQVFSF